MKENTPSSTAEVVALFRALESSLAGSSSILKDNYSSLFISDYFYGLYDFLRNFGQDYLLFFINAASLGLFDFILLRHAFIDSYVKKLGQEMPVYILGAGYDTRAMRLPDFIKSKVYELDFPATQQRKRSILDAFGITVPATEYIEIDFTKDNLKDVLNETKHAGKQALVIWEGVSVYVSEQTVRDVIGTVSEVFKPGTVMIADYWHKEIDDPLKNFFMKFAPDLMDIVYGEKFIFGAREEEMRTLARQSGVSNFSSYTGKKMMKELVIPGKLPVESASVAVMQF